MSARPRLEPMVAALGWIGHCGGAQVCSGPCWRFLGSRAADCIMLALDWVSQDGQGYAWAD